MTTATAVRSIIHKDIEIEVMANGKHCVGIGADWFDFDLLVEATDAINHALANGFYYRGVLVAPGDEDLEGYPLFGFRIGDQAYRLGAHGWSTGEPAPNETRTAAEAIIDKLLD